MKRVYHNYEKWEDHKHGMYALKIENPQDYLLTAKKLLCSPEVLYHYMKVCCEEWLFSAEHHMTNRNRNRQAWLGQAASCCYAGAPEYVTKLAWGELTDEQRNKANQVADKVILEWEQNYAKKV